MELNSYLLAERINLGNFAAGGSIGAAAATVDIVACLSVAQTTTGQTLTLPNPTDARDGRQMFVVCTGKAAFTMHGTTIGPNQYSLFGWHNNGWRSLSSGSDFWRDVTAAKALPDGSGDITEGIAHYGALHLGATATGGSTATEGFLHEAIVSYTGNATVAAQQITTNIPKDSAIMPEIRLQGYAYGSGDPIDISIVLYTYNAPSGSIINTGWVAKGSVSPTQIRAGYDAANRLVLEVTWPAASQYYNRYALSAYCDGNSAYQATWFQGWTVANQVFAATVANVVTVSKKAGGGLLRCDGAPVDAADRLLTAPAVRNTGYVVNQNTPNGCVTLADIHYDNAIASFTGGRQLQGNAADAARSFIGMGSSNQISAGSSRAAIVGGYGNKIISNSNDAVIGGGYGNTATGALSAIGGGQSNTISAVGAGGVGHSNVIAGGHTNTIRNAAQYSVYNSIVGGYANSIRVAYGASIGGGYLNRISGAAGADQNTYYQTISGGCVNVIEASAGYHSQTVAGGYANQILTGSVAAWADTISGGYNNKITTATAQQAGGDGFNVISGGRDNEIRGLRNTVLGGYANIIGVGGSQTSSVRSSIVGGESNSVSVAAAAPAGSYTYGNVALGLNNTITGIANSAANVAIGYLNQVTGHLRTAIGYGITHNTAGLDQSVLIAGANNRLGFYNVAPVLRQTLPAAPSAAQIATALRNLGLIA